MRELITLIIALIEKLIMDGFKISKQFDIDTLCDPIFYFYKPTRLIMKKRDTWPTVVLTVDLVIYQRVYQCKLKACPMPAPTPVQTVQLSWSSLGAIDDHGMCVNSSFY
jgi:hypothetical protein